MRAMLISCAVIAGLMTASGRTSAASQQPPELGRVSWRRGLAGALVEGKRTRRPVLVLFHEVPGCHTVRSYGKRVLSHPLIVEAAETLFVPVVVYNNVSGPDRAVLRSFGESTWNNPVVRIIAPDRRPLARRVAGDYTVAGLAAAMIEALQATDASVPEYLSLLVAEHSARPARATFSMFCFWSGEVAFGGLKGVLSTRAGFARGREIVQVVYDPTVLKLSSLVETARASGAKPVEGRSIQVSAKDTKYQIRHTALRHVPMTDAQASRVNTALGLRKDPSGFLSPRQRRLYHNVRAYPRAGWPVVVGATGSAGLRGAFDRAEGVAATLR